MNQTEKEVVEAWRAQYRRANGFEPTHNITYAAGWFTFVSVGAGTNKYRRKAVIAMTERLKGRADAIETGSYKQEGRDE